MELFFDLLLVFLLVCAIAVSLSKNLLNSIIVYMSFSLVMSVIWILLESPDLAITEAAVGAGVTSILFIITLKKIHAIVKDKDQDGKETSSQESWRNPTDPEKMAMVEKETVLNRLERNSRDCKKTIQEEHHE